MWALRQLSGAWAMFSGALVAVSRLMDRTKLSRKVMFWSTLWLTIDSYRWCKDYAEGSQRPGTEIAAIIGAVLLAVSALQGYVFKTYSDDKKTPDV